MATAHVGDIGTSITVDLGVDISSATELKFVLLRPTSTDRTMVKEPTSSDATSVTYRTVDGDFSVSGNYSVQIYYEDSAWSGYSTVVSFPVETRIYDVAADLV